jgi:hypothetical protein
MTATGSCTDWQVGPRLRAAAAAAVLLAIGACNQTDSAAAVSSAKTHPHDATDHADGHADGSLDHPDSLHGDQSDGHTTGHADGHTGGHWGKPEGACAAGTFSTLHPDCVGNVGCLVQTMDACQCGCAMCWQNLCVELACEVTPGCPDWESD